MGRYLESFKLDKSISLQYYTGFIHDTIYFVIHLYYKGKIFHKSLDARFFSYTDA